MYIVTNVSSVFMYYNWTMKDSLDGVRYETFEEAREACEELGGFGVAELGSED